MIEVGTMVMKDGYLGVVTEVCDWANGLVVVKLDSGSACVDVSCVEVVEGYSNAD